MRLRLLRGRGVLIASALVCAFAVPAAVAAAGSTGNKLPAVGTVAAPDVSSGQSSEIFLVELEADAATFRKQAKSVGQIGETEVHTWEGLSPFYNIAVLINILALSATLGLVALLTALSCSVLVAAGRLGARAT